MDRPSDATARLARALAEMTTEDLPVHDYFARVAQAFARFVAATEFAFGFKDGGQLRLELIGSQSTTEGGGRLLDSPCTHAALESKRIVAQWDQSASNTQIAVPVFAKNDLLGVLVAVCDGQIANESDLLTLETAAIHVGVTIARARKEHEAFGFRDLALMDSLTSLANRRCFDERLREEWGRALRGQYPVALVFIDVDFFGMYNTRYGHPAGDACLRAIASALQSSVVRDTDFVARYGGEEFVAILPATDRNGAIVVAERMRAAVEALALPHESTCLRQISISLGADAVLAGFPGDWQRLVDSADAMLLRAKKRGRNRVVADGYESKAQPSERRYDSSHNLPHDITGFVGREEELGEIAQLLGENRLVSLIGPAGVGKTRIACEAARRCADHHPDGVRFIDLSSVQYPEGVIGTVAHALAVSPTGDKSLLEMLVTQLETRAQLLVLDNCEHVIGACAEIVEYVLTRCAQIRVLATTRQSLEIAGETVFAVQPLSAGDAHVFFTARLRASAADMGGMCDAQAIGTICERLDCLPFALELVAPRVPTIGMDGVLALLEDSAFVLSTTLHRSLERQKTVSNLLEWSYRLLPPIEQLLLRRLCVLAGSWDESTAMVICTDEQLTHKNLHVGLGELVRKSLLVYDSETRRYHFLELTKKFGLERLRECGEWQRLRTLHAREMLRTSASIHEDAHSGRFTLARRAMLEQWSNIACALHNTLIDADDPNLGALIAANLAFYWVSTGPAEEATYWLSLAAAYEDDLPAPALAGVLLGRAKFAQARLDYEAAHRYARDAAVLFDDMGDRQRLGIAQGLCAVADLYLGNYVQAQALNRASLENAELVGDRRSIATSLVNIGIVAAQWQGDYVTACTVYERALGILRGMDAPATLARLLVELAQARFAKGWTDTALSLAQEAMELSQEIGDTFAGYAASLIAAIHIARGARDQARSALQDALKWEPDVRGARWITYTVEQCGRMAYLCGDFAMAARVNGFVDMRIHDTQFRFSAVAEAELLAFRRRVRDQMSPATYETLYNEGALWPASQAIEIARDIVAEPAEAA